MVTRKTSLFNQLQPSDTLDICNSRGWDRTVSVPGCTPGGHNTESNGFGVKLFEEGITVPGPDSSKTT